MLGQSKVIFFLTTKFGPASNLRKFSKLSCWSACVLFRSQSFEDICTFLNYALSSVLMISQHINLKTYKILFKIESLISERERGFFWNLYNNMQIVYVVIVLCTVNLCNLTLCLLFRMLVSNNWHESKSLLRESLLIHSFLLLTRWLVITAGHKKNKSLSLQCQLFDITETVHF